MGFTVPKTWSTGETLTAANFNTHIRDNLLAMGPHLIVRKPSDESVTSSTTLQDDDHLILPVGASEVWHFRFCLLFTGVQDSGDLRVGFSFPASGEIGAGAVWQAPGGGVPFDNWSGTTTPTGFQAFKAAGATSKVLVPIEGVFINSTTAGNLTLRWAQNASNATATIMRTNSTLWAVKLA